MRRVGVGQSGAVIAGCTCFCKKFGVETVVTTCGAARDAEVRAAAAAAAGVEGGVINLRAVWKLLP